MCIYLVFQTKPLKLMLLVCLLVNISASGLNQLSLLEQFD